MALIDVARAEAGMVLASDVLDLRGRVLIPAGAELKDKHVRALPAWGVTRVEVQGAEAEAPPPVDEWALAAAASEMERLFSLSNSAHPAIAALRGSCTQRAAVLIQAAKAKATA